VPLPIATFGTPFKCAGARASASPKLLARASVESKRFGSTLSRDGSR
jgi:hypothetical protein